MTIKYNTYQLFSLLLVSALLFACGSSQSVGNAGRQINYSTMSTLADALRVQSGVQVVGSANNIKVTIRGINSSKSSSSSTLVQNASGGSPRSAQTTVLEDIEPLFVIDNTVIGSAYANAARAVNVQDITAIKVLKSYAETNSYGETGKNGVILITTSLAAGN